jgi:iron complex transport system substrate-binding protein
MMYMAKLLHPEEFKDLDLEIEGNEIFKAFLGVDGVFTEYADYLVWPREYLKGLK